MIIACHITPYRVTVDDKYMNRQREPWRGHPLKDRAQLEMFFLHVVALGMADMGSVI